jgi:outer membrane protein assembly factor BamB
MTDPNPSPKPLRLWPGVALAVVLVVIRYLAIYVSDDMTVISLLGGLAASLAIALWWLFGSRARWADRLGAVALMAAAIFATSRLIHVSVAGGGMGMLFYVLAVPPVVLAFVAALVATRQLTEGVRRASAAAAILVAAFAWTLVRTGGISSTGSDFHWRWSKTPEERLLASEGNAPLAPASPEPAPSPTPLAATPVEPEPSVPPALPAPSASPTPRAGERPNPTSAATPAPPVAPTVAESGADWPGFRGADRTGAVRGVLIETDWNAHPPAELWRRPVGPGWSSFAVRGSRFYTQEQRGEQEAVACYSTATGEPVWRHLDRARFWESNAGAGPRATPTLHEGRVYTLGATGIVNALDMRDGSPVWSRNASTEAGTKVPYWGVSGSPLVLEDQVIVAASGRLVAYDRASGASRWMGPDGGASYSSPQLLTIAEVPQVLLLSAKGVASVDPSNGAPLWQHDWKGYPIVQPALTAEGDVLVSVSEQSGLRRLAVSRSESGWSVQERWTTNGLKPYFNDFVVHEGHAYGFDGRLLACVDLADGKRKWKGGRYGQGQLILLPDQDLLLVVGEEGELALVDARPEQFTERARRPALEGKTWNHPVLAGDVLLVRNAEEMAAFRLSTRASLAEAGGPQP